MNNTLDPISLLNLMIGFLPALIVVGIFIWWSMRASTSIYAIVRMLVQLLLIGYVLTYIFESDRVGVVLIVLAVMLFTASWISLRPLKSKSRSIYLKAFISISIGGVLTLILVTQGVLNLEPWFRPQFVIPLAGMIFANSMNTLSLAAERYESELERNVDYTEARRIALRAALIPLINTLFAVGLVSLPGMMTGQILSGVEPLVAARYQIMVMCMIFGSGGISAACFLILSKPAGELDKELVDTEGGN
jgi:putative ABC transport system permease protein